MREAEKQMKSLLRPSCGTFKLTRHFHTTRHQPVWYIGVAAVGATVFLGTRYIIRAQERIRRRREGLPDDVDEDIDDIHGQSRRIDHVLGLDFGTASLRLATASPFDASLPRVLESAEGTRAIPAVIAVDNDTELVGPLAKSLSSRKPMCTGVSTRILLNRTAQDLASNDFFKTFPTNLSIRDNSIALELDGKEYSPEWAAEIQLDYLHSVAVGSLGDENGGFPVVLSIPPGLNEDQKVSYERLAVMAGFDLVTSVEEPIAAMWAIQLTKQPPQGPIAVFDMGGYVSTFSILEQSDTSISGYNILSSITTTSISGTLVNQKLFQQVVNKFRQEMDIDLSTDPLARFRILDAVEAAKMELSSRTSTDINLPFITANQTGAKHLIQKITTFDIERALETPLYDMTKLCDQLMKNIGLRTQDIEFLVLIGGGVRSEPVRTVMERHFKQASFTSKDFRSDEAVVVGAAEFARQLVQEQYE